MRRFFLTIKIGLFLKTAIETHFRTRTHMINNRMLPLAQTMKKNTTGNSLKMVVLHFLNYLLIIHV